MPGTADFLSSSLKVPPTFYKDTCNYNGDQLPRSLHHSTASRKGPLPSEWTLDEANEKAKKVCLDALSKARDDDNLQHAKSLYDEYKKEGRLDENGEYAGLYDLENPKKKKSWDPEPEAISWGDETVTDEMCTTNEDGALTVVGTTALFADPYGAEVFNVVQLTIKVEVVRSEQGEQENA